MEEKTTMKKETENMHSSTSKKELTDRQVHRIMQCIGEVYRDASLRVDLAEHDAPGQPLSEKRLDDRSFVYKIDRSLQNCSKETQLMIRKEYLEISDRNWYQELYGEKAFRKKRVQAGREFLGIMDLV